MKDKNLKSILVKVSLAVLLVVVGFYAGNVIKKSSTPTNGFNPQFEEEQFQEEVEASQTKGIKIPGYSTIPVKANQQEVFIDLYNPEENEVYFEISFILTETNEEIFKSKLIKPGQHIYTINLNKPLPVGEYPVTIKYNTYSADENYTPKNGASVSCIFSVA